MVVFYDLKTMNCDDNKVKNKKILEGTSFKNIVAETILKTFLQQALLKYLG